MFNCVEGQLLPKLSICPYFSVAKCEILYLQSFSDRHTLELRLETDL